MGFWDHLISARRPGLIILNKKRENLQNYRLCYSCGPQKECDKRDKYMELARELKKTVEHENGHYTNCNFCYCYSYQREDTRTEDLEIKGWVETVQITALLRSTRILRSVLETWGNLLSLKLQWETIGLDWYEKLSRSEIIMIIIIVIIIHWELCQKFKFDNTNKWYMHNPASVLENETHKLQWDFNIQRDHQISARQSDLIIINKKIKKKTCRTVKFAAPAHQRVKLKESEKKDNTWTLLGNWKKLWDMNVMFILIVIGALSRVTKRLVQGMKDLKIRGGKETIQTTPLLRSAWFLRRVLETWGDLLSLKLERKTISWKISQGVNNNYNNNYYNHRGEMSSEGQVRISSSKRGIKNHKYIECI